MHIKSNLYESKCIAHCTMCFAQKHMPCALSSRPPAQDLPDAGDAGLVNSQGASDPTCYNFRCCPRAPAGSRRRDIRSARIFNICKCPTQLGDVYTSTNDMMKENRTIV